MTQALILIDIQNDYFPGGSMELVGMERTADNARRLLDRFRSVRGKLFHIQHLSVRPGSSFFVPGTDGVEINGKVSPAPNACATRDLRFGERVIEAADVHGAFMSALSVPYAKLVGTDQILADQ